MNSVQENLTQVQQELKEVIQAAGRSIEEVTLMAVSKTWPAEHIQHAINAGHTVFGENKVQEGEEKIPQLAKNLEWHMIGHLQRNKVRKMLPLFDVIHSIDSLKLANYTNRIAAELGLFKKAYLQVNIGEEAQKTGFLPADLCAQAEELAALDQFDWQGLMCIPPATKNPEDSRLWFSKTRELRDDLKKRMGLKLPNLSMGMSSDYRVAIEEGSTIVRVGSAIFGQRNYKTQ